MNKFFEGFAFKEETAVAFGLFDGMHLGHQVLFSELRKSSLKKVVLTFDFIKKYKHFGKEVLTSLEDKERLAKQFGMDDLYYFEFDEKLRNTPAEDFIKTYFINSNIKEIYVGEDFRFGSKGKGDVDLLKKLLPDTKIIICPLLENIEDRKISTTEIIRLIKDGNISLANRYLGRNYSFSGMVVEGYKNGQKLGFPTANIVPDSNYVVPKNGVYVTKITINNVIYLSMTNIGTHPTIDEIRYPIIETHILNYSNEPIYNKKVTLEFVDFIRNEIRFTSVQTLINQLNADKNYISKNYTLLKLVKPDISMEKELNKAFDEFKNANETHNIPGAYNNENINAKDWLEFNKYLEKEDTCPEGLVPGLDYVLVDENSPRILGFINIRLKLNDHLFNYGGHIGYSIVPSERNKGKAYMQLKLALRICKKLGLQKVLLTCDEYNIASQKTIVNNGGILENKVFYEPTGKYILRYWIEIK